MKRHTVTVDGLRQFASEAATQWRTYAFDASSKDGLQKRLEFNCTGHFRVIVGRDVTYELADADKAVAAYNEA